MRSLKQRMPAGEKGMKGECLRQVQEEIMWKWEENTFQRVLEERQNAAYIQKTKMQTY